jgi:hypothetical protein
VGAVAALTVAALAVVAALRFLWLNMYIERGGLARCCCCSAVCCQSQQLLMVTRTRACAVLLLLALWLRSMEDALAGTHIHTHPWLLYACCALCCVHLAFLTALLVIDSRTE